jgi:hypothetical protein
MGGFSNLKTRIASDQEIVHEFQASGGLPFSGLASSLSQIADIIIMASRGVCNQECPHQLHTAVHASGNATIVMPVSLVVLTNTNCSSGDMGWKMGKGGGPAAWRGRS